MSSLPDSELDRALSGLDSTQRKVLGGVVVTMIKHHDRVRDAEWLSEQFVAATALAMDIDLDFASTPESGVEAVRAYANQQIDALMPIAFGVFARVASEMQRRTSFTFDDAAAHATQLLGATDHDA